MKTWQRGPATTVRQPGRRGASERDLLPSRPVGEFRAEGSPGTPPHNASRWLEGTAYCQSPGQFVAPQLREGLSCFRSHDSRRACRREALAPRDCADSGAASPASARRFRTTHAPDSAFAFRCVLEGTAVLGGEEKPCSLGTGPAAVQASFTPGIQGPRPLGTNRSHGRRSSGGKGVSVEHGLRSAGTGVAPHVATKRPGVPLNCRWDWRLRPGKSVLDRTPLIWKEVEWPATTEVSLK